MLLDGKDVAKILGPNIKKARLKRGYTQEFLAEKINISIDLLRNIENSRNVGSIQTLLNLCNFLEITPNAMFENLYTTKDDTGEEQQQRKKNKNIDKPLWIHSGLIIFI